MAKSAPREYPKSVIDEWHKRNRAKAAAKAGEATKRMPSMYQAAVRKQKETREDKAKLEAVRATARRPAPKKPAAAPAKQAGLISGAREFARRITSVGDALDVAKPKPKKR